MKTTQYFDRIRLKPDRAFISNQWIMQVVRHPERVAVQTDGRIRKWGRITAMGGNRYLRVVLLPDGETVHNAFFDRGYRP